MDGFKVTVEAGNLTVERYRAGVFLSGRTDQNEVTVVGNGLSVVIVGQAMPVLPPGLDADDLEAELVLTVRAKAPAVIESTATALESGG